MTRGRAVQRDNPSYNIETVSKVYADVAETQGSNYYDVEGYILPTNPPDPYQLIDWIGAGKYSDVFKAKCGNELVAIKVLKPVRAQKYNREAKILATLKGGPNIVNLLSVVQNPKNQQYSFVFEYVNDFSFDKFFRSATDLDARFYL